MATFTIDSFNHWQWAANSVYYLLSLWSRLVASMPYLKGDVPSQLESFVPQVITSFINSRMELVRALLSDNCDVDLDDPLKDEEQLTEQLETLPSLCRFQLQQVLVVVVLVVVLVVVVVGAAAGTSGTGSGSGSGRTCSRY